MSNAHPAVHLLERLATKPGDPAVTVTYTMKGARPALVTDALARQYRPLLSQQIAKRRDCFPTRDDGLADGRMEPEKDSLQVS